MDKTAFAQTIDHTLLKPGATSAQIETLCREAHEHGFFSVCVNPDFVALAKRCLQKSSVKVCTVVGFPLGASTTATKVFETREAILQGADEIDMVVALSAVKNADWDRVKSDIAAVVQTAEGRIVKVILETCLLTDAEKIRVCELSKQARAQFVKTSTGFSVSGATVQDVALMRQTVGSDFGVKASGGIRDAKTAQALFAAGANRLGLSASVQILQEFLNNCSVVF